MLHKRGKLSDSALVAMFLRGAIKTVYSGDPYSRTPKLLGLIP